MVERIFTVLPESNEDWWLTVKNARNGTVADLVLCDGTLCECISGHTFSEGDRVYIGSTYDHRHQWGIVKAVSEGIPGRKRALTDRTGYIFGKVPDGKRIGVSADSLFRELISPSGYCYWKDLLDTNTGFGVITKSFPTFSKAILLAASRLAYPVALSKEMRTKYLDLIQNGAKPSQELIKNARRMAEFTNTELEWYQTLVPWPVEKEPHKRIVFAEAMYFAVETLARGGFIKLLDALLQAKPKLDDRIITLIERPELAESPQIRALLTNACVFRRT